MIPYSLRVSGFLSYFDPVELDFSLFDLACISGANGAGKSSLLDAITWGLFGQARRRDDALIHSHSNAAEVMFEFGYEGNRYRIQRSKPRDKSTLLEFSVETPDGWRALTEKSVRETDARIQSTLRMDYETFINASFFLQGKADQFAQQRPGDRKRILSSILGLEVWEAYRDTTAERRKRIENEVTTLDGSLEEIYGELRQEEERRARLQQLEEALAQLSTARQAQEATLDNLRRLAATLAEQRRLVEVLRSQVETTRQRHQQRMAQIAARQEECAAYRRQLAGEAQTRMAYQAWQSARQELERWEAVSANFRQYENQRSGPLMAIEAGRARLESELGALREQERQIQILIGERLPELDGQLAEGRARLLEAQARLEQRAALEERERSLMAAQSEAAAENKHLREDMLELKERIDRLREASGVVCPLCGQPLAPDERQVLIANLEAQGKELGDRYRQNQALGQQTESDRQELARALSDLRQFENEVREYQRRVDQLEHQGGQWQTAIAGWQAEGERRMRQLADTLAGGQYAADERAELARIDAALRELGYDAAQHDAIRRAEMEGRSSEEALRQIEAARAALGPLEREIAQLGEQQASEETRRIEDEAVLRQAEQKYQQDAASLPDVQQAERELYAVQEQENRVRMQVGGARQGVEVLKTLRQRSVDLTARRDALNRQVARLKMLERAFGKDGVPALLIEQALPEVELQTNDLLDRLSGGSMSVRFATQRDFKDKNREDKKETLDILISDSAGWREYELFSGGEAFRVNFAIRLALSRVLAQRAGARLQTLVIDEGFGSQDAEGRQRLVEAINLVKGDFAKILVITHLEELKEAFPARIEVEKTLRGSRLRVVA